MFVFLDNPLKQRLFCGTRCKDMLARVCILTNGACRVGNNDAELWFEREIEGVNYKK